MVPARRKGHDGKHRSRGVGKRKKEATTGSKTKRKGREEGDAAVRLCAVVWGDKRLPPFEGGGEKKGDPKEGRIPRDPKKKRGKKGAAARPKTRFSGKRRRGNVEKAVFFKN